MPSRTPSRRSKETELPDIVSKHGYKQVRDIGRGSFGVATLVQDAEGDLLVMKTIEMTSLNREHQKDAVNEVTVLSSLKHPYIIRYHQSFVDNGILAIIMDYAEGGDLHRRIRDHRTKNALLPESRILRWLTQVTLGLKYLHSKNIIHRDLKPENIFLTRQDDARIGDFGISKKVVTTKVVEENPMGTPYYSSPEIWKENLYTFASDIWAVGCILYELQTLRVPFQAQNLPALIDKITHGSLAPMSNAYSKELRDLCKRMLCQDHKRRPITPDVIQLPMVQGEIRRMLRERPMSAQPSVCSNWSSKESARNKLKEEVDKENEDLRSTNVAPKYPRAVVECKPSTKDALRQTGSVDPLRNSEHAPRFNIDLSKAAKQLGSVAEHMQMSPDTFRRSVGQRNARLILRPKSAIGRITPCGTEARDDASCCARDAPGCLRSAGRPTRRRSATPASRHSRALLA